MIVVCPPNSIYYNENKQKNSHTNETATTLIIGIISHKCYTPIEYIIAEELHEGNYDIF